MNFLKNPTLNKKWLTFLILVGIFFLILPRPVFGVLWDPISGVIAGIPYLIIGLFLAFGILITQGLALLMGAVLNFVTGPNFISFSYTNPANNPIIEIGLGITKSFVNMGLVVVLIFIALSITLRLNETEAKKAFTRLIIIALLVNFAPVICGLIVDATNIVMNYFIVGIKEGVSGILSQITDFGSVLWDGLKDFRDLGQGKLGIVTQGIFQILLNLNIAFVFFLFALMFIFRYLAIWVLVILSPIAFVAWILPASRRIWDIWWEQLIQWSIIGIPLAFFLYLGMRVFEGLSGAYTGKLAGVDPTLIGFFDKIFPYFIVLSFLYLGFLYGLQFSALGAGSAISWAKGGRRWARRVTARGIEKTFKIPERAEQIGRWAAKRPVLRPMVGRPLIGYAKRRREEMKKELEGLPFEARSALTGKSIQEIVRGMKPREFVREARPDDLKNPEVFLATSLDQVKQLGIIGSVEQKEAFRETYLKRRPAIRDEWKRLIQESKKREEEGKRAEAEILKMKADILRDKTRHINTDPNFKYIT